MPTLKGLIDKYELDKSPFFIYTSQYGDTSEEIRIITKDNKLYLQELGGWDINKCDYKVINEYHLVIKG